jgi:hypothetical protein
MLLSDYGQGTLGLNAASFFSEKWVRIRYEFWFVKMNYDLFGTLHSSRVIR